MKTQPIQSIQPLSRAMAIVPQPISTILFKARVQDGYISDPGCALLEVDANLAKQLREVITKAQQALAVCPDARSIEIWFPAPTLKDFGDEDTSPFDGNYDPMFVYADGCPFELSDHDVDCLDALVVFRDGNEFCFRGDSDDDGRVYKTYNMPIADLLAVLPPESVETKRKAGRKIHR